MLLLSGCPAADDASDSTDGSDSSTQGGTTDGGSTDDGTTDDGTTDDGTTDDGSTDDGTTDDGTTDDGSTDDTTDGEGFCGDGVVQPEFDEQCDDANSNEFDGCTSLCEPNTLPELEFGISAIKQFEFAWAPVFGADYYQLLERADVDEDFVQIGGDIVGESIALTVPLHLRLNGSYKLRACGAGGCAESAASDVVGNLAEAVGYFKASNTDPFIDPDDGEGSDNGDYFGWSVALSGDGDTLAVGAFQEDSNATGIDGDQADGSTLDAGAVYLFVRDGGSWSQQAYIKASNTDAGDGFGHRLALSHDGSTLAVGAFGEASSATGIGGDQADNSAAYAGAAYVFVRDGETWSQEAYIKASNTAAGDSFGVGVALADDGNTLAVGAEWEDSAATNSGATYVFVRDGGVWAQQAYIKASNPGVNDRFGASVALSSNGDTLAVGAWVEDSSATGIDGDQTDNSASAAGAAYVFVRDGALWSQQAYIKASNSGMNDYFGVDLALSNDGDTLAVGASGEDSGATGIDGDQADNSVDGAGAIYVFVRDGAVWAQQAYVKSSNTNVKDHIGRRVALAGDGNLLVAGAWGEGSSATGIGGDQTDNSAYYAGATYVFERADALWSQEAYVKGSNSAASDHFGTSVALSEDGRTLAVGAYREASNATGVGGDQANNLTLNAGAVYLY